MRHIYKKVELQGIVNVDTVKQEIEDDKLSRDKTDDKIKSYQKIVVNNIDKDNVNTSQMEHWSILSNVGNCVQYDRNPKNFHELNIKALDQEKNHKKMYEKLQENERQILDIDFGDNPDKLNREYLDIYEGVQLEVLYTTRFDESLDLRTTYLERTNVTRAIKIKAEENFALSGQGYMVRKLLDNTECQSLLDMGTSKSYMSKSYYLRCKSFHSLPKFTLKSQRIGNTLMCFSLYQ